MSDQATRVARNLARQDYERQMTAASGGGGSAANDAGPPTWNRQAWDVFKAANGFYPFGMQGGGMVLPPTFAGAPDWVFDLMNIRRPPITVHTGADLTSR